MTKTPDDRTADPGEDADYVTVTIMVKRETYEKAKAHVADRDPGTSPLGEYAGMFGVDEYLGNSLDTYCEDRKKR